MIWDRDIGGDDVFIRGYDSFRRAMAKRGLTSSQFIMGENKAVEEDKAPVAFTPSPLSSSFKPQRKPSVRAETIENVVAKYVNKTRERKAARDRRSDSELDNLGL